MWLNMKSEYNESESLVIALLLVLMSLSIATIVLVWTGRVEWFFGVLLITVIVICVILALLDKLDWIWTFIQKQKIYKD